MVISAQGQQPVSKPGVTPRPRASAVVASYGHLPLSFVPNVGQANREVEFLAHTSAYTLYLTPRKAVFAFSGREPGRISNLRQVRKTRKGSANEAEQSPRRSEILTMELLAATRSARATGSEELPSRTNYFLGNNPARWRTNVPNFARVNYKQIYPGVDLAYYGNQSHLEYDFVVAPGASARIIELAFQGATAMQLDATGALEVLSVRQKLVLSKPRVYQRIGHSMVPVEGRFTWRGRNRIGFQIGAYDRARPLIIDPTVSPILSYSTYLGGSQDDEGSDIVVDSSGNAYIVGSTDSTDFPTSAPEQASLGAGFDAFVAKLNSKGTALVYSTYLGGSNDDHGAAIAIDSSGNAYVTGNTASPDFPTTTTPAPLQSCTVTTSDTDAFVAKLNASGDKLLLSTCVGGTGSDRGLGIALDSSNNIYISGDTTSSDFPVTTGAYQTALGTGATSNAFFTKVKADGSGLAYSTYLGGTGDDHARAIAFDNSSGNAFLTGNTTSSDFPVTSSAFQSTYGGAGGLSIGDAFLTELKPAGKGAADLVYSTYLGGGQDDAASGIALDSKGNAYITGVTESTRFPTKNPYQATLAGTANAFVAEINPGASGSSSLVFSTYLGGSGTDQGSSIAVDSAGNIYLTGATGSRNFPVAGAFQTSTGSPFGNNAFYAKLSPSGQALVHSSYLGGNGNDAGRGVAIDSQGNAYIVGSATSSNFPVTSGAFETAYGGAGSAGLGDAFVTKVLPSPTVCWSYAISTGKFNSCALAPTAFSFGTVNAGSTSSSQPITLTNGGDAPLTINNILASGPFSQSNNCPASSALKIGGTCTINVVFSPTGAGVSSGSLTVTDDAGGSPQAVPLTGTGAAFKLSAPTASATVTPGQSANFTLDVIPNGFVGSVAFNCGGAPAGATCTVSPTTVSLNGSAQETTKVQVTTTAHSLLLPGSQPVPLLPAFGALLAFGLALLFFAYARRRHSGRGRRLVAATVGLIFLLALTGAGCSLSNSTSGTPAGTYNLTVQGTSGGLSQAAKLTLTIK